MESINAVEALKKIKNLLFNSAPVPTPAPAPTPAPTPAPAVFTDYTLQDGTTVVQIDNLAVGGKVTIAGAPAADGELCLQDGTCITVAAGVITAVTPKAADPAPVDPAPVPAQMSKEQMTTAIEKFAALHPDLAVILRALMDNAFGWEIRKKETEEAIALYKENFARVDAENKRLTEGTQELFKVVEQLAQQDTATPVEEEKKWEDMTALERFRATKKAS